MCMLAEQVRETFLRLEVFLYWNLTSYLQHTRDFAVFGLKHREHAGLLGQPCQANGVMRSRAPAQRARDKQVDITRAAYVHRLAYLVFQITQIGHRRRGDIRNVVRHGDLRHVFALAEHVARLGTDRHGGRGTRRRRCGRRTLHASVHVGFVVVTDVQHIVVALEHSRQTTKADVGGAAVAALRHDAHIMPPLHLHRSRDTCRNSRSIAEQRMYPRHLPGRFGIRRGKHFETTGRVCRNQLPVALGHRRVDRVSRAECLSATLTGAMPGVDRVAAHLAGLHAALVWREQPVADGECTGLVKFDWLKAHNYSPQPNFADTMPLSCRMFSAMGPEWRFCRSRSSCLLTASQSRSTKVTGSSSSFPA